MNNTIKKDQFKHNHELNLTEGQIDFITDGLADNLREYFEGVHQTYPMGQPPAEVRAELIERFELTQMLEIPLYTEDKQWMNDIL